MLCNPPSSTSLLQNKNECSAIATWLLRLKPLKIHRFFFKLGKLSVFWAKESDSHVKTVWDHNVSHAGCSRKIARYFASRKPEILLHQAPNFCQKRHLLTPPSSSVGHWFRRTWHTAWIQLSDKFLLIQLMHFLLAASVIHVIIESCTAHQNFFFPFC